MPTDLRKRWLLKTADEALVARHSGSLKIPLLLARLLAVRGLADADSARRYLSSTLRADLPSPFVMADMEPAVERIVRAIRTRELIGIWGDYDVDGTTGAALLVCFLREVGAEAVYHIPHRIAEGYGLNIEGLRQLKDRGVALVITVDCGISNADEIAAAVEFGLDVVVVDHHQPPETLPPAIAVINPHRPDCGFPDKGLCAAGLAFYLLIGLRARLREAGWFAHDPDLRGYLDVVALGTIADMVPLRGVNRTLLRRGLSELGGSTRPGIVALKAVANLAAGAVSAGQVGFQLGPRINAAGRVDYGIKVVELLTTNSREVALRIAGELEEHNRERRALEAQVLEQALAHIAERLDPIERYTLVLAGEGWHPGVLGIVASRIVERHHRPTVVIGFSDGKGKGSARSIRGFHMVDGFRRCAGHLEKFGGHEYAGGLSIHAEKLDLFSAAFEAVARELLSPDDLLPLIEIDAELQLSDVGFPLLRQLESLQPFGIGNPEPLFVSRALQVCDRKDFASGARFRFGNGARVIGGVAFGLSGTLPVPGDRVDVAYRVNENEWNGASTVELKIVDLQPAPAVFASPGSPPRPSAGASR